MNISEVIALVKDDLNAGFASFLTIEFCDLLNGSDDEPFVLLDPIRRIASAYWQIVGVDDQLGFPGMFATGQRVVFEGVTLVEFAGVEPLVTRVIDWSLVHAQVGAFPGRQVAYSELSIPNPL